MAGLRSFAASKVNTRCPGDLLPALLSRNQDDLAKNMIWRRLLGRQRQLQVTDGMGVGVEALIADHDLALVGYALFKEHIGFYPMSGSFLEGYKDELKGYVTSKGAVQFPIAEPLPVALIKRMIKGQIKSLA